MRTLPDYPWDAMAVYAARAAEHPDGRLDLSVGSPIDPSPDSVRKALAEATDAHAYPATNGTPKLRAAIADWYLRRRGVTVDPEATLPTVGSKELVALLPFLLGLGEGDIVVHPRIAYPSYETGAALVGATAVASDDPAEWPEGTKLVWVNSPGNPTGEVLGVEALRAAVERARELGAIIAGDECYAEFGWTEPWQDTPIPSILDPRVVGEINGVPNHDGVIGVYSLSKQSNLAGYRAAFIAGDAALIGQLLTARKHAGLLLPAPVQAAMVAALEDEAHVAEQRERYRARRAVLAPALERAGFRIDASEAGLYLWATRGVASADELAHFADLGIVVAPGTFYGEHAPLHVRLSMTATDANIAEAAKRITGE